MKVAHLLISYQYVQTAVALHAAPSLRAMPDGALKRGVGADGAAEFRRESDSGILVSKALELKARGPAVVSESSRADDITIKKRVG